MYDYTKQAKKKEIKMLVIFKNEEGTYSVRPAFIGFIKNDILRRTLGIIFYPFVISATILINIIQAALVSLIVFVRAIYHPLANISSFRKSESWKRARTKEDKNSKMD